MARMFECETCGVVTASKEHLCSPRTLSGKEEYCGDYPQGADRMCAPMRESLEYECSACGRPADEPGMVCAPEKKL